MIGEVTFHNCSFNFVQDLASLYIFSLSMKTQIWERQKQGNDLFYTLALFIDMKPTKSK